MINMHYLKIQFNAISKNLAKFALFEETISISEILLRLFCNLRSYYDYFQVSSSIQI